MDGIGFAQRAQGALLGAWVGDALALGPHWYYDLDAMRRDYGAWISDYTMPRADRYHAGLCAGQSSQSGLILDLLLRSLVDCAAYDEADFCRRLDEEFLPQLDGTPLAGPGGYTSQSMRETYRLRVQQGRPWGECAGLADTTEAAERVLALAVRHAHAPAVLAQAVAANTALTQRDTTVLAMTVAYASVLGSLLRGEGLDAGTSDRLMALVRAGELPFHRVTSIGENVPASGPEAPCRPGEFPSPDALLSAACMARAALDPGVVIEPAWKVSLVYGMPCAVYHQFPAAYYLAARFQGDFEQAVLHAVNGGGQNMARAMLTGALCGAIGGVQAIPARFLDGLERIDERRALAATLARQAASA